MTTTIKENQMENFKILINKTITKKVSICQMENDGISVILNDDSEYYGIQSSGHYVKFGVVDGTVLIKEKQLKEFRNLINDKNVKSLMIYQYEEDIVSVSLDDEQHFFIYNNGSLERRTIVKTVKEEEPT